MSAFMDTVKAIITRVIFSLHGVVAIHRFVQTDYFPLQSLSAIDKTQRNLFRVVTIKDDPYYWYLGVTILLLTFEGIFTLTIKKSQDWKWYGKKKLAYALHGYVTRV